MNSIALVIAIGLLGPLLTYFKFTRFPVVVGELLAGAIFGVSGFDVVNYNNPTIKTLAQIGFGLAMLQVGSHINIEKLKNATKTFRLAGNLILTFTVSIVLAIGVHSLQKHIPINILVLLFATSSAAVILPIFQQRHYFNSHLVSLVVALDLITVIAIPLILSTKSVLSTVNHVIVVALLAVSIYYFLNILIVRDAELKLREFSIKHKLGLELRFSMLILVTLAGIAVNWGISILVVGFSIGLVLARLGVPERLSQQIFAISEGFFAPFFYVWLGSQLNFKDVIHSRDNLILALLILIGTYISHLVITWGEIRLNFVVGAQLGVPTAIATVGLATHKLTAGQGAAIMFAAIISVVIAGAIPLQKGVRNNES